MAAKRGRQFNYEMSNEHRLKIANSNILNYLIEHALGNREMGTTQCQVALGLLRKVLPDLASVEHSGSIGNTPVEEMTDAQVNAELAELRAQRTALNGEEAAPNDPTQLH